MSMQVVPVCVGFAPTKTQTPKRPWVMDETLPKTRDPQEVMNEKMKEKLIERVKNKPDEERNFFDYLILAQDKLEKMKDVVGPMYIA